MPGVQLPTLTPKRKAWNKGQIIGQKRPLLPQPAWAIRTRLEIVRNHRDLALFNVAIDSKLRGCDLVKPGVNDIVTDDRVRDRVSASGLKSGGYGAHSLRGTKAAETYRKTGNLRSVQLLFGHVKLDSTVRFLDVDVEDALIIADRVGV